jgi:hypothetical protein
MDKEYEGKCIACKHFCEATKECRKYAPSGKWPETNKMNWCGDYITRKNLEFDK